MFCDNIFKLFKGNHDISKLRELQSGAFFDIQVTLKFKDSTKHKNILLAHAYNPQIHNNTPLPPEIMYRFYNKEKPEVNCLIL